MASSSISSLYSFMLFFSLLFVSVSSSRTIQSNDPTPTPWPHQFHSILVMNFSGSNEIINLWYDWTNGRNFNIIQKQLGGITYDCEWNNGTSFFWTSDKKCSNAQLEVGILTPNWLDGANYLGQQKIDGFLCNVWEKADFITYYEDVVTKRPVHWVFYTRRSAHVMTFEVGAVLGDEHWQAPSYCFEGTEKEDNDSDGIIESSMEGVLRSKMGGLNMYL
ncbi:hypothetical protein C5167_023925 [Papaver somniferum]|uniref:Uncharacterized protein n=1 Tax=Papaver somniferum TaxID=3469 RepID=A0A4Y7JN55_PAPSO|nr:uncharacterized protein At4g14100-like [Papaver somniferum]RZC62167.1 hypothetical protein C5167_023925 [Papaver somniferum]